MKKLIGIILGIMCVASVSFADTDQWTLTSTASTTNTTLECPFGSGEFYIYSDAAISITVRGASHPLAAGNAIDFEDALFYEDEVVSVIGTANIVYQWRKVR